MSNHQHVRSIAVTWPHIRIGPPLSPQRPLVIPWASPTNPSARARRRRQGRARHTLCLLRSPLVAPTLDPSTGRPHTHCVADPRAAPERTPWRLTSDDSCVQHCLGSRGDRLARRRPVPRNRSGAFLPGRHHRKRAGADRQRKRSLRRMPVRSGLSRFCARHQPGFRYLGRPHRRRAARHPSQASGRSTRRSLCRRLIFLEVKPKRLSRRLSAPTVRSPCRDCVSSHHRGPPRRGPQELLGGSRCCR